MRASSPAVSAPAAVIDDWPAGFELSDGIHLVSPPRRFAHDEAAFDATLCLDASVDSNGNGLVMQLRWEGYDFSLPALEIAAVEERSASDSPDTATSPAWS